MFYGRRRGFQMKVCSSMINKLIWNWTCNVYNVQVFYLFSFSCFSIVFHLVRANGERWTCTFRFAIIRVDKIRYLFILSFSSAIQRRQQRQRPQRRRRRRHCLLCIELERGGTLCVFRMRVLKGGSYHRCMQLVLVWLVWKYFALAHCS